MAVLATASLLGAGITINDIDKLVNDIKQERVGLKDSEIRTAKDPFVYSNGKMGRVLQTDKSVKKRHYRFFLSAIINDRAKINGRWYRLNSRIGGFRISGVGKDYVLLTRKNERIRIFLNRSKSKKIKLLVK
ncbi:hypothetical protein NNO_0983 [Hydrogenimonas sp.]|nr:hypothetical protein NNO_0983 [Hydrogenimonas sp.]